MHPRKHYHHQEKFFNIYNGKKWWLNNGPSDYYLMWTATLCELLPSTENEPLQL